MKESKRPLGPEGKSLKQLMLATNKGKDANIVSWICLSFASLRSMIRSWSEDNNIKGQIMLSSNKDPLSEAKERPGVAAGSVFY